MKGFTKNGDWGNYTEKEDRDVDVIDIDPNETHANIGRRTTAALAKALKKLLLATRWDDFNKSRGGKLLLFNSYFNDLVESRPLVKEMIVVLEDIDRNVQFEETLLADNGCWLDTCMLCGDDIYNCVYLTEDITCCVDCVTETKNLSNIINIIYNMSLDSSAQNDISQITKFYQKIMYLWSHIDEPFVKKVEVQEIEEDSDSSMSLELCLEEDDEEEEEKSPLPGYIEACCEIHKKGVDHFLNNGNYHDAFLNTLKMYFKQSGNSGANTTAYDNCMEFLETCLNDRTSVTLDCDLFVDDDKHVCLLCNMKRKCSFQVFYDQIYVSHLGAKCSQIARSVQKFCNAVKNTALKYDMLSIDQLKLHESLAAELFFNIGKSFENKSKRSRGEEEDDGVITLNVDIKRHKTSEEQEEDELEGYDMYTQLKTKINAKRNEKKVKVVISDVCDPPKLNQYNYDTVMNKEIEKAMLRDETSIQISMNPLRVTIGFTNGSSYVNEVQLPSWTEYVRWYARYMYGSYKQSRDVIEKHGDRIQLFWLDIANNNYYKHYKINYVTTDTYEIKWPKI